MHINTPLIESRELSALANGKVISLKLDCLQNSGSFKIRGIGLCCTRAVRERGCKKLISSSGGNAGVAVAFAAHSLGVPSLVVVPVGTPTFMIAKISSFGTQVIEHGSQWSEAHAKASELANEEGSELIHPFEHADIWEGHASLIEEVKQQLPRKPSSIITVVGGGGLLSGLCLGLERAGWLDVPVFAVETDGAQSFAKAIEKGELVTLPGITSIAKTLGAATVSQMALDWSKKCNITSVVVDDKEAVQSLISFMNDHRLLVEVSCAAGLSILYHKHHFRKYEEQLGDNVLVIVCGGNIINSNYLDDLKRKFEL